MLKRRLPVLFVIAWALIRLVATGAALAAVAQDHPAKPVPTVTEVQKLKAQTLVQQMQIAQYKVQLASQDFEQAKTALQALAASLQVEGYTLDLETWTYTVTPPKTAAPATK